jgi:ADP-heptose:LPS heptosyltransferase
MKKLLVCHAEGLGNCVEILPCIRTIKEKLNFKSIDYWHAFGSYNIPKIIPYVDKWVVGGNIRNLDINSYYGKVSTFWTREHHKVVPLPLLNKVTSLVLDRSEIDVYMDIARDLGVKERDILWYGNCNYNKSNDYYDIVIHDGCNRGSPAKWEIKSYPHYKKVVDLLKKDFSICSVGAKDEYIDGTDNMTGKELLDTLGIIKNCKLFLSNDSGLYHCANALEIKNIVLFTATSITKNFDSRFHKYSTLIKRDDLECRPCQGSQKWRGVCKDWKCREIDPETVVNKVRKLL